MSRFLQLVVATLIIVAIVSFSGLGFSSSDVAQDFLKDLGKAALGSAMGFASTMLAWILYEKRLYSGWVLSVTSRTGTETRKSLPAEIVKKWLADDVSDFGGFRDLTGSVNRWKDCGLVTVDADTARSLGALMVDNKTKILKFDYSKLPAPPAAPQKPL